MFASALAMAIATCDLPVFGQVTDKVYGDNMKEELGVCYPYRTEEYIQYKESEVTENFAELPRVEIKEDWRTQGLESAKIPLSKPLIFDNPITGKTVGVLDRNWKKELRVSSFWGRNIIRIRIQTTGGRLFAGQAFIPGVNMIRGNKVLSQSSIGALGLKNDKGYIVINGCDGVFNVTKQVADALVNYPLKYGKAFILLSNDGSTGLRINEIGPETVKAWKTVYRDWDSSNDGLKKEKVKSVVKVNKNETPKESIRRMLESREEN